MTGGSRRPGTRKRKGGGAGSAAAAGGAAAGAAAPGAPPPVEFNLFASKNFDLEGCPGQVRPPHNAPDALARLTMHERAVLGDIVLWFAACSVAEPTARLVMWQATKEDRSWLTGYVESSVPQLVVSSIMLGPSSKVVQFQLRPGLIPLPPESAAEAADAEPQPGSSDAAAAAAAAAAPEQAPPAAAGGAAASAAAKPQAPGKQAAAPAATSSGGSATAAHDGRDKDAGRLANGAVGAAADKARTWFDGVQAAYGGRDGPPMQLVVAGAAAVAVTALGIVLGAVFGRRRH